MGIRKSKSAPQWMWKATKMTEEELQSAVVEYGQALGWFCFFIPDWIFRLVMFNMKRNPRSGKVWSAPGMPDLVLMQGLGDRREPVRLVLMELKSHKGRLREPQWRWIVGLRRVVGIEVYLIRPTDWLDGTVERILTGGPMPDHPGTEKDVEWGRAKWGNREVREEEEDDQATGKPVWPEDQDQEPGPEGRGQP